MPYKDKEKQKEYQRLWAARRKEKWFKENGPCVECGSIENLELHHKDPSKKEDHRIWTWSEERRQTELAKCEVRCSECHDKAHTIIAPEGFLWCSNCKQFVDINLFGKSYRQGHRRNYRWYCNPCRKSLSWS